MRKIGVGVVGVGALGFDQAKICRQLEGVSVVRGADPSATARDRCRTEAGIEAVADYRELMGSPEIDLVLVSTPNAIHVAPALAALDAGKAVLLQKPMALSMGDCRRILDGAARTGTFLQVGFECRYSLLYARIGEILRSGQIGDVRDVGMEYCPGLWPTWFERAGAWKYMRSVSGGMVLEKLSHYIDLIRWYVGRDVREVRTICPGNVIPYFEIMDNLRVFLVFENGATGTIHFSFTRSPASDVDSFQKDSLKAHEDFIDLSLTGTAGSLSFNRWFRSLSVVLYRNGNGFRPTCDRKEDYTGIDLARLMHDNATELADVVGRVREGRPPRTMPADSLETMRVCFAAEESASSGESVFLK